MKQKQTVTKTLVVVMEVDKADVEEWKSGYQEIVDGSLDVVVEFVREWSESIVEVQVK